VGFSRPFSDAIAHCFQGLDHHVHGLETHASMHQHGRVAWGKGSKGDHKYNEGQVYKNEVNFTISETREHEGGILKKIKMVLN
jgi:hypothetical protein